MGHTPDAHVLHAADQETWNLFTPHLFTRSPCNPIFTSPTRLHLPTRPRHLIHHLINSTPSLFIHHHQQINQTIIPLLLINSALPYLFLKHSTDSHNPHSATVLIASPPPQSLELSSPLSSSQPSLDLF